MHVTLGPQGRIVIPAEVRKQMHWEPGAHLVLTVEDGKVVIVDRKAVFQRLRGVMKGQGSVDEFLAERRAEAAREQA